MKEEERTEKVRVKMHRDLAFLMALTPTFPNPRIAKYLLQPVEGEPLSALKYDYDAHYNFFKYDYSGKLIDKNTGVIKLTSDRPHEHWELLTTMVPGERSWFNIANRPFPQPHTTLEEPPTMDEKEEGEGEEDDLDEVEEMVIPLEGHHLEVFLQRVEFKNGESMEVKRLVHQQGKEKGRELFKEGKYGEAAKVYKFQIHITENLQRGRYSADELGELESMNVNSRLNYLRCILKIKQDWQIKELADFTKAVLQSLLQQKQGDHLVHFLHAKWLLREGRYDDALEAVRRSLAIRRQPDNEALQVEIQAKRAQRGKLKVAVPA